MCVMEATPPFPDLRGIGVFDVRNLLGPWCPAERNEEPVRRVAQADVAVVDDRIMSASP